jgi:hypothetical protein
MRTIRSNEINSAIIKADRTEAQREHGERYEHRQRVNGQPNGYAPISEAELQALRTQSFAAQYEG